MTTKTIDGLPVLDARSPVMLKITAADIKGASVKRPETCAAAKACLRDLHALEARVHLSRVYVKTSKEKWIRYFTPHSLRAEIIAFDRGGTFAPGEYELAPVTPIAAADRGHRQGGPTSVYWAEVEKRRRKRESTKGYKSRPRHVVTDVRTGPA